MDVQSDKQLDEFVRSCSDSAYHPSCTAKMGAESDHMAVCDPQCRVYGLENLRVVDASIMPSVITGKYHSVGCMGWRTYVWSMPQSCLLSSLVSTTV